MLGCPASCCQRERESIARRPGVSLRIASLDDDGAPNKKNTQTHIAQQTTHTQGHTYKDTNEIVNDKGGL